MTLKNPEKAAFSKGKDRLLVPSFSRGYISGGVLLGEMLKYAFPKQQISFSAIPLHPEKPQLNVVSFFEWKENMSTVSKTSHKTSNKITWLF